VTIELNPEQERIIEQQSASGHFKSVEEVPDAAVASLPDVQAIERERGSEAVRRVIEFAEKRFIRLLPGEKIKDLVHDGHRF
jgi:Arc/MetJ-type ribon-helix-helix transcriptional regulator